MEYIACSNCFEDKGLSIQSALCGDENSIACPNCNSITGNKLTKGKLQEVVDYYFVYGSMTNMEFGNAPVIIYNVSHPNETIFSGVLEKDSKLIKKMLGIRFFLNAPQTVPLGAFELFEKLVYGKNSYKVIHEIIENFKTIYIDNKFEFFRVRNAPTKILDHSEYDAPPKELFLRKKTRHARFDSKALSVLYGSQDIELCIHECRFAVGDDLYFATLAPSKKLKLLDFTQYIGNESYFDGTSDLAMNLLCHAQKYSYRITRKIAKYLHKQGYDGLIYRSFFTGVRSKTPLPRQLLRTNCNIALFGFPISEKKVEVRGINSLHIHEVAYNYSIGIGSPEQMVYKL